MLKLKPKSNKKKIGQWVTSNVKSGCSIWVFLQNLSVHDLRGYKRIKEKDFLVLIAAEYHIGTEITTDKQTACVVT